MFHRLFPFYAGDLQIERSDFFQHSFCFLFFRKPSPCGREYSFPVIGFDFPVSFRLEIIDGFLSFDQQGECRCLYPPDREDVFTCPVFQGVGPRGIHAQQPVADRPSRSCRIKRIEIFRIKQFAESFPDSFLGQR